MANMKMTDIPNMESLDRVHLDKKEDIMRVVEWGFEHKNVMDTLTASQYPLPEALVKYSDIAYHHFKTYKNEDGEQGNLVLHSLYYYGELYLSFIVDLGENKEFKLIYAKDPERWGEQELQKYMFESYVGIQALMAYMLHYREDFEYKEVRHQKAKKVRKGKSKKKKKTQVRVVKIGHYYMNVDTVQQRTQETRQYNRQTESWRVRGHWRTYKSGKRVWIKPQVRGKKDGKIKPTIYKV